MTQRPHVSAAIIALRGWVATAAAVVCLCALLQLLVYCFAAYTDVRYSTVVSDQPGPAVVAARSPRSLASATQGADVNRVLSVTDRNMAAVSGFASSAGLATSVGLVLLTMLGVAVGGGGAVPGVEKMVKACAWSMVCACLCLPWGTAVWGEANRGGGLLPGVFCSYSTITSAAELSGGFKALSSFVIMPTAALTISALVALWFHAGVESGVIVTAMSDLDRAVEREVAQIRARGVTSLSGGGRVLGALNQALGDAPVDQPRPLRKAAGAESMSEFDVATSILRGGPAGDPPKRPI